MICHKYKNIYEAIYCREIDSFITHNLNSEGYNLICKWANEDRARCLYHVEPLIRAVRACKKQKLSPLKLLSLYLSKYPGNISLEIVETVLMIELLDHKESAKIKQMIEQLQII